MNYDIVIRNGQVVDGTGAAATEADIAIAGQRIAAIGRIEERGRREIDATGKLVTPGFIDIHTHLDAQIMWDPQVTSPCWHGITTVVMGNCGLSLAPAAPENLDRLIHILESVEDIPGPAMLAGNRFEGGSFGDYLDMLDALPKGLNVAAMVGHVAVRVEAMGERSFDAGPTGEEDIARMCKLVRDAIDSGAFGFSTSRSLLHTAPDGRHIPGTYADTDELMAIGRVLEDVGRGIYGSVPAVEIGDPELHRKEIEWMAEVSKATGRPFTFAVLQNRQRPELHREILEWIAAANRDGAKLYPQTEVRSVGVVVGIANITPFDQAMSWVALKDKSISERLAALRDPEQRARLVKEGNEYSNEGQLSLVHRLEVRDGDARYDFGPETSLWAIAKQRAVTPADAFVDIMLESDGRSLFIFPFANFDMDAVGEMLAQPGMLLGLADSGAHVSQICDTSFSTYFLRYWVGERGLVSLAEGVRKLTSEPAEFFGFEDRGVLREGAFADINVIDLAALRVHPPEFRNDLPTGAGRYVQQAAGIDCTLVNGEVFMEGGGPTGAYPGRLLRSR